MVHHSSSTKVKLIVQQPPDSKRQNSQHATAQQRPSTVSQDRASRLQQAPTSQSGAQGQNQQERRKVQPPNNLNLQHPSATITKDHNITGFTVQHSDNFAPNSFLQQLKPPMSNFTIRGVQGSEDVIETQDRCLTTTAASAPKNLIGGDLQATLNSAKNSHAAQHRQVIWDSSQNMSRSKGSSAAKDTQPAAMKRRESSAKTTHAPSVTYSSLQQAATTQASVVKPDLHIMAQPSSSATKSSSTNHQQRNNSGQQQQVQQAQIMQQQQLKLHNLNTDQQYFQQNITTETLLPSSSKSQKSVKSTKSSKQKAAQASYTAAIQYNRSVQHTTSQAQQASQPTRQTQKQSPSVEREATTRIDKHQNAPKTVAKKKPSTLLQQPQNPTVNPKSTIFTKQMSSQKKQQSHGSQQRQVQFAVQQPQPPTIYDPSQQIEFQPVVIAEQSPTNLQQQRPTQLSLTVSNNNNSSLSQITSQQKATQPQKQSYNLSVASTSQTPKTFKVKSQTATHKQAAAQAGIIFDQGSKLTKQQNEADKQYNSTQPHQESLQAAATSGKGTTKQQISQVAVKQQQNASRGQASDTKASRQSIQQNQQQAVQKVCKTTKSTSLKRNTQTVQAKPAVVYTQQHNQRDLQAQAKSAMTMKSCSKTSTHPQGTTQQKYLQRAPSNSASHEKIKVTTVNQQNSSERSPNGISSQDARSTKAANKSFQQIAHSTQLMSCSSGGESTQQVTTKNRSLSGKAGGPQIKINKQPNLGLSSKDFVPSFQPVTTTNLVQKGRQELDDSYNESLKQQIVVKPSTTQNFKTNQTFSFEKEERKKIIPKESSKQQHAALINLKNVRSAVNSTSQDSKKPTLNIISNHQNNQQQQQQIMQQQQQSQSPTPARGTEQQQSLQIKPTQPQASDDKKLKLNLMKSDQPSSYQIPVHQSSTTNAQSKPSVQNQVKAGQIKKTSLPQAASQKKTPHPPASTKLKTQTQQFSDIVEFNGSMQLPSQKVMYQQNFEERISLQVLAIQCASDQQAEQNINMDDPVVLNRILKQIEKLPLKENDGEQRQRQPIFKQQKQIENQAKGQQDKSKERQERSKERILESLKSLEMKIDSFSHAHEQHSNLIQQMLASQQNRRSAQSNYSTKQALEQVDEPKARGTPQPNSHTHKISEQQQCVDLIAALPNFERSARLLLVINEEPRLSLISEGINSLQTVTAVDDFLKNSHQASINIQTSSEQTPSSLNMLPGSSDQDGHNYDTVRQISKCSNYCPGGTLDNDNDLSMSLSDIQPPASENQARGGLMSRASSIQYPQQQRPLPQVNNVDEVEENEDALELGNIIIEEKNQTEQQQSIHFSGQQSAPHIPIINKVDPIMTQSTATNQTQVQKEANDFEVERFSKSQKLRKQEIIVSELNQGGLPKAKDDHSSFIQEVQDKITNISANSAEVNQQFHSLERIRQESSGSQLYSKKLTNLFKNQKLQLSKGNIVQQERTVDINFKVQKKSMAQIKQKIPGGDGGAKKGTDHDTVLQAQRSNSDKDSSLEITNSLLMNQSSDLQSRSGLSQIVQPAQRIAEQLFTTQQNNNCAAEQQVAQSGKSSGSISPFQQKFRIQQRSQERENIFLAKNNQARTESMMGASNNEPLPASGVPQIALNQQYVLMGQLGCATPKSHPSGKILITKQKFNQVVGQQNKSPEVTTPLTIMLPTSSSQQSTQQQPQLSYAAQSAQQQQPLTSFSASQLQEMMKQKQSQNIATSQYRDNSQPCVAQPAKKEKKLQIVVKASSGGGSGETVDLLQHNSVSKIKMAPKQQQQFSRAEMQRRSEDNYHRQQ